MNFSFKFIDCMLYFEIEDLKQIKKIIFQIWFTINASAACFPLKLKTKDETKHTKNEV